MRRRSSWESCGCQQSGEANAIDADSRHLSVRKMRAVLVNDGSASAQWPLSVSGRDVLGTARACCGRWSAARMRVDLRPGAIGKREEQQRK